VEIQLLPAEYGDAIIIKTMAEGKPFTIVVDGGPKGTSDEIAQIYKDLGHIDLMILTHFDEDHIMGLIKYVKLFREEQLPVDRFWCNCAQYIDIPNDTFISAAGYENANTLAAYLRAQRLQNPSFEWREDIQIGTSLTKGDLNLYVVSPSPEILTTLKEEYNTYIRKHPQIDEESKSTDIASYRVEQDAKTTIDDLVKTDKPRSVNLWNKASIAFLLIAEGKQILLTGDADADTIAGGLERIPEVELPIHLDLMKAAHHGSKNNISLNLLEHIRSNRFAFTTNGGIRNWYHPDRKTIALMLRGKNRDMEKTVEFIFNYPLEKIESHTGVLMSTEEKACENCITKMQKEIKL